MDVPHLTRPSRPCRGWIRPFSLRRDWSCQVVFFAKFLLRNAQCVVLRVITQNVVPVVMYNSILKGSQNNCRVAVYSLFFQVMIVFLFELKKWDSLSSSSFLSAWVRASGCTLSIPLLLFIFFSPFNFVPYVPAEGKIKVSYYIFFCNVRCELDKFRIVNNFCESLQAA